MTRKKFTRRETLALTGAAAATAFTPNAATAEQIPDPAKPRADAGMFDPLTGLPNEALFYDRTRSLMRIDGTNLTVAIIDIDDWQAHTAKLGIRTIPPVILTMSRRITRHARGELYTVGRLRDAQFGLLFAGNDPLAAPRQLETIRRAIRAPMWLLQRDRVFTSSIGVMRKQNFHTHHGSDLVAMTRHATLKARLKGRDNLHYYDPYDLS